MVDLYHSIYDGEIFRTSNCIWHENTVMDFVRSQLQSLGYRSTSDNNKIWQRDHRQVVICLVDDFSTCRDQPQQGFPYQFDANTVVITDNHVTVPTVYTVCQLPASFFGIYSHSPASQSWQPDRRFNFSVNRLDTKRMWVMLELWNRAMYMALTDGLSVDCLDLINFNCWQWHSSNDSTEVCQNNFTQQWQMLEEHFHSTYDHVYQDLLPRMPWHNHNLSHEQAHVSAWANVVMETYSSDSNIALSEKTFRALCLPVPWIVYSGKHTVAYLRQLGFDVMPDLIAHNYDGMIESKTAAYGDKIVDFIFEGSDAVSQMKHRDFSELQQRCSQAAQHNRHLLANMKRRWPSEFAQWWSNTVQLIA